VKYDLDVDPEADNNSHALVLDLVGRDRDVLDVGCATGYLARALVAQGCTVTGVELDEDAARQAAPHLAEVRLADLDRTDLARLGLGRRFDVVVFADVLEHLKDPLRALRASVDLLRPGGRVVVSIPNVAHGSVRLALLDGRFDYREIGLLDDTHIRFFTRSTLLELLTAAGLVPSDVRRTTAGVFATEIPVDPTRVPEVVLHDLERDDDAETYQFVLSAVPTPPSAAGQDPSGPAPGGVDQPPSSLDALDELRADATRLRADNERLGAEAAEARRQLDALLATRTFRALQPARALYGRLRALGRR
jgi:2-polyprenyl-3-methyl-5-hydroxy-6-metoxy-1,4-benzoquinol methylase